MAQSITLANTSANYSNVFIGTTALGGIYNIANGGSGGSGLFGASTVYTTSATQNAIKVQGDAEFEGRVKINGQDLVETLNTIQRRLSILVPDPKLLDKYEALKQAYEHYKTLEALCIDENSTR